MASPIFAASPFQHLLNYFRSFVHLFYPHICLQCGSQQLLNQQILCSQCITELPYTQFSLMQSSPVDKVFWGRVKIHAAFSIVYFTKESIVQKIIKELKYKQNKKAGYLLGQLIAQELLLNPIKNEIDYFIPIPISNRKKRIRGFNQCQLICEAIKKAGLDIPIFKGLIKIKNTSTQTHKDRQQRGSQINHSFELKNATALINKRVLIIDDVLTTGATLEAAVQCIQMASPAQISIATAAYTVS